MPAMCNTDIGGTAVWSGSSLTLPSPPTLARAHHRHPHSPEHGWISFQSTFRCRSPMQHCLRACGGEWFINCFRCGFVITALIHFCPHLTNTCLSARSLATPWLVPRARIASLICSSPACTLYANRPVSAPVTSPPCLCAASPAMRATTAVGSVIATTPYVGLVAGPRRHAILLTHPPSRSVGLASWQLPRPWISQIWTSGVKSKLRRRRLETPPL